jgi:hypothetical protein
VCYEKIAAKLQQIVQNSVGTLLISSYFFEIKEKIKFEARLQRIFGTIQAYNFWS